MNRKRARFQLCVGAALVAGLLLRLWFVRQLPMVAGDPLIYGAIARNWLQAGVYGFGHQTTSAGLSVVRPTLIRLPGYPMFLAVCFRLFGVENYRAVMFVQVAADLLTCWLASALAGRLFGSRAALAVLWLAALCPFTANYVAAPLTETLGVDHHRAGILRLCPLAGRRLRVEPMALGHLRNAWLLHSSAP